MSAAIEWAIGPVKITTEHGTYERAGYLGKNFSLDIVMWEEFNGFSSRLVHGWAVSHRKTGYRAFVVDGILEEAKRFTEELEGLADWDFDDPSHAKELVPVAKKMRERPEIMIDHSNVRRPA